METSWDILSADAAEEAEKKNAKELEQLNQERKDLLMEHSQKVLKDLEGQNHDDKTAIFIEGEHSPQEGFSGLIAQRVLQKHQKPSIVMLKKDEDLIVASCRSLRGVASKNSFRRL